MRVGFSPTSAISTSDPGSDAAAAAQNATAEQSPGTRRVAPVRRCPPMRLTPRSSCWTSMPNAESARSVWSLVAVGSLDKRVAVGVKTGQEDRTLDLRTPESPAHIRSRAGSRRGIVRGGRPAVVSMRAPMVFERPNDPLHRTLSKRRIPGEPRLERVRGQYTGEQTHRRARVACVELRGDWAESSQASAVDRDRRVESSLRRASDLNGDPELAETLERRPAVGTRRIPVKRRRPLRQRRQDCIPGGRSTCRPARRRQPRTRRVGSIVVAVDTASLIRALYIKRFRATPTGRSLHGPRKNWYGTRRPIRVHV